MFSNFDSDDDDAKVFTAAASPASPPPTTTEWERVENKVGLDGYTAYTRQGGLTTHWLIVKGNKQPIPTDLSTVALFDIVTVSVSENPLTGVIVNHCEVEHLQASDLPYGVSIAEVIQILQKLYAHGKTADPNEFVSLVLWDENAYPLNQVHAKTRQIRREAGLMRHYEGPTTFSS
jgi:hypothetical protein